MSLMMKVVEFGSGLEHELPGDAVTRDAPTLGHASSAGAPLLPLAFRCAGDSFHVPGARWPELAHKLVRLSP